MTMVSQMSELELDCIQQAAPQAATVTSTTKENCVMAFLHSFRRRPAADLPLNGGSSPVEGDTSPLNRSLKGRHLQFIAIGGSIGAGLFIGCGKALANGGPASLLIGFIVIGIMMFCVLQALCELAAVYPVSGSFAVFSTRFIDKSWGFAMGWNYALQWLVVLPFELVAAGLTLAYWNSGLSIAVWITIFWVLIILINMAGVRGYGDCEMIFAIIKIAAVITFAIAGIVIDVGGVPGSEKIGLKYWTDPGSFNNGVKGLCTTFITAGFSLAGTELVGLAAAETDNPRKTIPQAAKQVFWRIILFYVTSIFIVGCIVPYTHPQLLSSEHSSDVRASPFVIAIQEAGIKGLPSVINAVILIAALSVGNSSTYASSRTIQALGDVKQAPKIFGYVDMWGRPLAGQILALMCGILAYFSCLPGGASQMFDWLLQISALSSFFTWGSICLAHIRFRAAMKKQAESIDLLPFRACFGIYGSYLALTINFLCIVVQVYLGFSPIRGNLTVKGCLMDVIAVPVIIGFYVVRRVCKRKDGWVRLEDMDLISGRKDNLVLAHAEDAAQRATWGCGRKVFHWFC